MSSDDSDPARLAARLREIVEPMLPKVLQAPTGTFRYPWLEPGACYRQLVWDWDSYFCGLALVSQGWGAEQVRGSLEIFLEHQGPDGSIPFRIMSSGGSVLEGRPRDPHTPHNSAKPIFAQFALLAASGMPPDWLAAKVPPIERHLAHWKATQGTPGGLLTWRSHRGCGPDNHPAIYGRPQNSAVGLELNCWLHAEWKALAEIGRLLGDASLTTRATAEANAVASAINTHLWDETFSAYLPGDALTTTPDGVTREASWINRLACLTWTSFMPLWSGAATPERAERMVREHLLRDDRLLARWGVRTLARTDPLYNLEPSSNPSNWQGPVWIVSNYLVARGLRTYGFHEPADRIALAAANLLVNDFEQSGTWHEFYHPDTGQPLMNPDFINWNVLALALLEELIPNRSA